MPVITQGPDTRGIKRTSSRGVSHKLDLLDQRMDGLYKDIYISRPDNKQNLDSMIDGLDTAIDKLQGIDASVSSMSELLRRIDKNGESNTFLVKDSTK